MKTSTINYLFDACVVVLEKSAALLGISYQAINIWIFCVIGPVAFFTLTIALICQIKLTRKFKRLYIRNKDPGQ